MVSNNEYKYKFSIVMAIYNVEEYLEESILSVINQKNVTFELDVQLILVNDGSEDGSGEICERYKELYPDNIVYIKKENGGVSSARNLGIEFAVGKYINFLDSDDKFKDDVLYEVESFFDENEDIIDVLAIGMKFFEASNKDHVLNYKFEKTRIVNILEDFDFIQLSSSSAFIKNSEVNNLRFDEDLHYLEDAYFMSKIILRKMCYGVLSNTIYFCRKRNTNTSATQNLTTSREWYTPTLKKFHLSILKYCNEKIGYIPYYIQYLVMYDLQWRIRENTLKNVDLSAEEKEEYQRYIGKILTNIEDIIIKKQKFLWTEHRLYCFNMKYNLNTNLVKVNTKNNMQIYYKELLLHSFSNTAINLEFMEIKDDFLIIDGFVPDNLLISIDKIKVQVRTKMNEYTSSLSDKKYEDILALDNIIMKKRYFNIKVPVDKILNETFEIGLSIENVKIKNNIIFRKYIRLYKDIDGSYFENKSFIIKYENNMFTIKNNNKIESLKSEFKFVKNLYRKSKRRAIIRFLAYMLKKFSHKSIWVFMDRIDRADDNAEALFKYVQNKPKIYSYFILDKNANDYSKIKKFGKVVKYKGLKQKILLLLADNVISSHVEHYLRQPFGGNGKYIRSLCDFKFVFLQHGITKDNMSNLFNRYNKNIDLFITSGIPEYESIFKYDYFYDRNQVKLTGFPRHDYLNSNPRNKIVIMPTWRKNLACNLDTETGKRLYNDKFKDTEYFKIFNKLINDKEIIEYCNRYGYKLVFLPHPNIMQQIDDFDKNNYVEIIKDNINYNKILREASCLITDYSSLSFEFGYMKKPVIYYQFDYDEVFNKGTHSYEKGYYDYEYMGFGPVLYEYSDLVKNLKNVIINECILDKKYEKRIDDFFEYVDKNNCKRVYEEILNL